MKKKSEDREPAKEKASAKGRSQAKPPKAAKKTPAKRPASKPGVSAAGVSAKGELGIKKQCLKSRPICKVTFTLPGEAAPRARQVTIVGDFNGWDEGANPLRKLKSGNFTATLELEKGRQYRFRYLIDGERWENDWCADRYVPNPHGTEDSVVVV